MLSKLPSAWQIELRRKLGHRRAHGRKLRRREKNCETERLKMVPVVNPSLQRGNLSSREKRNAPNWGGALYPDFSAIAQHGYKTPTAQENIYRRSSTLSSSSSSLPSPSPSSSSLSTLSTMSSRQLLSSSARTMTMSLGIDMNLRCFSIAPTWQNFLKTAPRTETLCDNLLSLLWRESL